MLLRTHKRCLSACLAPTPGAMCGRDIRYSKETSSFFPITISGSFPHSEILSGPLVFSFIKYFDESTSDEDEANVYMEREWRVIGDVKFALADVHRVFMPERYAERFRADLPNYTGQLTFSDNI